ncbi:MAG TPA: transglycosylase domain-containing protein, partial [Tepidiformaceae bacterium]|nr:transglycosylase domain-containing protein [Tepidiformaceae bacterium]
MNAAVKRRMRERRAAKGGMPWWAIGLLAIGALGSITAAVGLGVVFTVYTTYADEYVPIEEKLSQRFAGLTEVYDRSGPEGDILLGSLPNPDAALLDPVPLSAISQYMIDATVSTEDNTFWSNPGINFRGLMRAAWENYVGGGIGTGSGGSSITQQLIKNVYLSDDCETIDGVEYCFAPRTLDRKMREIAFAIELEKDASKEQIMEWYLNQTSYAGRYVGVEAAAQGYFRKAASELTLAEAALLSGIPQSPSQYHPRLNCEVDETAHCIEDELGRTTVGGAAKLRQGDVLDLMVSTGAITESEAAAAKAEVLRVYPALDERLASAFIDNQVEPFLVRLCEAGEIPIIDGADSCEDSLQNAGYKITTSLDYPETSRAEALVKEQIAAGIANGCNCHNASIVTIDPRTGQMRVYVPNIDPTNTADDYIQGDIDQATEINQPGSSFKPAVYLAWFEYANKAPYSTFWDTSPLNIAGTSIVNPRPGGGGEGLITARAALGGSQNVGAVRAAIEAGPDNVIEMAKKLGITTLQQGFDPTFVAHSDISYGASIATGGANIRVVDMAYMQTVFANMGVMVGTPTRTGDPIDLDELKGTFTHPSGEDWAKAVAQYNAFNRGDIRLPGTRTLDPIVVLKIEGPNGELIWEQGEPERIQVVDAGSVWLLQSIMTDCSA